MGSRSVYGLFGVVDLALVGMMVWFYAQSSATIFLAMAAFGLLFVAAAVVAAVDEWNTAEELEDAPVASVHPAHG